MVANATSRSEIELIIPHLDSLGSKFVVDSMGITASVNLTQLALNAAVLDEITRNDGHWAVQRHSRSPLQGLYVTSYQ